ncbi:catalase [Roseovarius sp. EL26]|uniref:catalase n=1 Tax=Roseovarius sp. EL26 TaxID=2126672 RepID=UPI000EA12F28|nr:catalase [Roseovarius sp. EL26]
MTKVSTVTIGALALTASALAQTSIAQAQSTEHNTAEKDYRVFEKTFGATKGKRRNHTKGFCFVGEFAPVDNAILAYSNSPIFSSTSEVNGRVSHKGGKNLSPDDKFGDRGLAFEITTPDGDYHIINVNTEDFFPASKPADFIDLVRALGEGGEAVKALAAGRPELQAYLAHHKKNRDTTLRPYEGTQFNSVNAFYLVNESGDRTAIRWSMVPSGSQGIVVETNSDFLMDNMNANLTNGTVSWDMVVTIANDNDDPNNAAIRWEGEHTRITATRLTVTSTSTEADGECDAVNFDPTVLSDGFVVTDDPILEARSQIYAHGIGVRLSEKE